MMAKGLLTPIRVLSVQLAYRAVRRHGHADDEMRIRLIDAAWGYAIGNS